MTAQFKAPRRVGRGIKVASFFSGAGGLDLGFDEAGFEIVYATDIDARFCETLKINSGKLLTSRPRIQQADIRQLALSDLPKRVDLVIGGPPCQTFSASGRRAGGAPGRLDARGTLIEAYCRILAQLRPSAFLFENVRGILGTHKGKDWEVILGSFRALGYKINFRVLDALDYGAPQQRERLFLVGHKLKAAFLFPSPLFGPNSPNQIPHLAAAEAFQDLVEKENLGPLFLRTGKYAHLLPLVPPGQNYLFFTSKRGYPKPVFAYRSRFSDFLYKANPDTPIKTLIARPGKYTGPFHWDNRSFSIAEYRRLQGFPDGYEFAGSRDEVVKQIGNSVSPKIAYQLALAIAKQVFNRKIRQQLLPEESTLSFDQRKGQKARRTRELHDQVVASRKAASHSFQLVEYQDRVEPCAPSGWRNISVRVDSQQAKIVVHADKSRSLFARMNIEIEADISIFLDVEVYGKAPHTVQTMWNAIDDWVIRSSDYHSLFELYGHFTEPHPIFKIVKFQPISKEPIALFAKHCADFANCSQHFPREHLTELFGVAFKRSRFIDLVQTLRSYRYDIRCFETNITMPRTKYMVAYPFTLPMRKQMNFSVRGTMGRQIKVAQSGAA